MKKMLLATCMALTEMVASAQQADPIVMRIAGVDVPRSEFEYNYNKNNSDDVLDKKSVEEYVDMFVDYKLKVKAAEDARYDTLSSYQKEFRQYRDQQIRPLLVKKEAMEREVRSYYDGMLKQLDGHDLRMAAHIFLRLPQNASKEEQEAGKVRIDSIYQAYLGGASYEELAKNLSDDKGTAVRGGLIPQWLGPGNVIKEMEDVIYQLKDSGDVAKPILSPVGYHIIQLRGKKNLESYEQLRPQIEQYLDRQGVRDRLAQEAVDALSKDRNITAEEALDIETAQFCKKDPDLRYLVKEYHDGLLLFEIMKTEVWDPAAKDSASVERYFKDNKDAYAYDKPHFRGMVFYCKNKRDVKAVKKLLKKADETKWIELVRNTFNKDSVTVRMEQRVFAQGENAFVDKIALKQKKVAPKEKKGYPYADVVGKVLKRGPEKWTDVGSQVVTDYQASCEKAFVEGLRKRYEVKIYPEVIATVNKH